MYIKANQVYIITSESRQSDSEHTEPTIKNKKL